MEIGIYYDLFSSKIIKKNLRNFQVYNAWLFAVSSLIYNVSLKRNPLSDPVPCLSPRLPFAGNWSLL